MPVLTIVVVLAVTLAVEAGCARAVPSVWRAGRWVLLPPLGGVIGALVPMGAVAAGVADQWLSLGLGVGLGALGAVWGTFESALWRRQPAAKPAVLRGPTGRTQRS